MKHKPLRIEEIFTEISKLNDETSLLLTDKYVP